eukprot:CAMPEP_0168593854 /NCGR_PEP_ID=MMETSP0420-20121227/8557_1 /TAXON_ID=498008 /ORGANISM="Pessonella sp." /LENGTH=165 /DNA_ID=CAMNT_0008630075 /DNA_START=38 /DNA_END=535 /DNA_ORIENTATION=+
MPSTKTASFSFAQDERAFQKQPTIFVGDRAAIGKKKRRSTKTVRYYKNIGLGYRTPKEAIHGDYVDKKCPWTGNVSIRGRILRGVVLKAHMKRTVIIRRDYLHYIKKYNRFEKRHRNLAVHVSPAFRINVGDTVEVGQCRPLSKTVRFNVLKVITSTSGKGFKKF